MDIFSRFLYQSGQYSKNPPRLKHSAFPIGADGKVSVYQTDQINEQLIWALGSSLNPNRRVHGRGNLTNEDVEAVELVIEIEGPHPLHRNIIGWPFGEPEQLSKAMLLANKARLVLCP